MGLGDALPSGLAKMRGIFRHLKNILRCLNEQAVVYLKFISSCPLLKASSINERLDHYFRRA
jgi:hypothetical protein